VAEPFETALLAELPRVRSLLRRLSGLRGEVDDLVQEVWLRAHRYQASFDPAGSLSGWLATTAYRVFLDDRARRARAPVAAGEASAGWHARPGSDPAEVERVERLLASLRPIERDVLLRFHRDGASLREIASALALPEGTVKSHLHRARRRLAER
jgi:RNA polymerase sigma-70 factor (ECF subfamily)